MKITGTTNNISHLLQFAVKDVKQRIVFNDKAIIYNRCSDPKQDSLGWQEKSSLTYAKINNLEVVKIFGEKHTATTDDRAEFQKMLRYCEKENISNIIIYSYDRFSRTGDVALLEELRRKGIKVHASSQSVDDQSPSGRFAQKMYLLFAELDNEQRKARIIEGQRNKLRKGEWIGKPTIGYEKRFPAGKKTHELDKRLCYINEVGHKIKQAFLWRDQEKLSYEKIIERLEMMGLTLNPQDLTNIFKNIFYIGYITSTLLDEGEIIRGKHEALISEEVFFRINGIDRIKTSGWNVVREHEEMPLKTSVRCGNCNRPLTAYPQKGKYFYYKCPNAGCCVNIRNKKLHDLFATELSKLSINESQIPFIKGHLEATYWMLNTSEAAREKPMKDELTRLKNELENMEFNHATSKITTELFLKFSESHKQKISEIESSLGSLGQNSSNLGTMLDNTLKMASNLLNIWQLSDYNSKVRLQNLIFPEGLQFDPQKQAVRTLKINPIFSAMTYISTISDRINTAADCQKDEKSNQLYLMFSSSNFFWGGLNEINSQMIDFEVNYPNFW